MELQRAFATLRRDSRFCGRTASMARRHSRGCGNPAVALRHGTAEAIATLRLDSRFRGNDGEHGANSRSAARQLARQALIERDAESGTAREGDRTVHGAWRVAADDRIEQRSLRVLYLEAV